MTIIEKAKKGAEAITEECQRSLSAIQTFKELEAPVVETQEDFEAASLILDAVAQLHKTAVIYVDVIEGLYEDINMQIRKGKARRN